MKAKALFLFLTVFVFSHASAYADASQGGAVQKIKNEVANAVTDELVGKETVTTTTTTKTEPGSVSLPPGLAKKGKVPPGWAKKMEGQEVTTTTTEKEPSLIQKWVKAIFSKAQSKEQK